MGPPQRGVQVLGVSSIELSEILRKSSEKAFYRRNSILHGNMSGPDSRE